jgi:hypothetical protein
MKYLSLLVDDGTSTLKTTTPVSKDSEDVEKNPLIHDETSGFDYKTGQCDDQNTMENEKSGNRCFPFYSYVATFVTSPAAEHTVNERPQYIDMGFSLVNASGAQHHPVDAEAQMIKEIWPEVKTIMHVPPFLTLICEKMPSTIPLAIADVPCHFTLNPRDIPLVGEFCRGPPLVIGTSEPVWQLPSHETRIAILQVLLSEKVVSIVWLGSRWLLEVMNPTEDTKTRLPVLINGLVTSFRPFKEPSAQGLKRSKIPNGIDYDDTNYYPKLHAGMVVCDGDIITTSGCPVYHPNDGIQCFTIASHGFINGTEVRHPLSDGTVIGIADKKFGETDISLCRITDQDVEYSAETFAGPSGAITLKDLQKEIAGQSWVGKELFLDSPFTGLGIGYVIGHGSMFLPPPLFFGSAETPLESPDPKVSFVSNLWIQFENGLDDPKKGCCGAPLFDKDGHVYGFFNRYTTDETATSYCPTPNPLVNAGYVLGSFKYEDVMDG